VLSRSSISRSGSCRRSNRNPDHECDASRATGAGHREDFWRAVTSGPATTITYRAADPNGVPLLHVQAGMAAPPFGELLFPSAQESGQSSLRRGRTRRRPQRPDLARTLGDLGQHVAFEMDRAPLPLRLRDWGPCSRWKRCRATLGLMPRIRWSFPKREQWLTKKRSTPL
jgi:hypothetical protein